MSRVAVRAEGLAKRYRIRHPNAPGWRQYLAQPVRALRRPRRLEIEALRHVSFDVEEGEVFGIVGRNGAGKSTLLKILSRITTPTAGRAVITGRVASLLEVGTGFHPELTGRENVYLNGTLLGMSARAVGRAFDEICAFACVGPYIDTPIKRYSSGMQLRLAFAVAAHLAADTMIIDEVLAVGDAEFQRKCMGAMRDVQARGRTTLFVSHNMAAVEAVSTRVMWLDRGCVRSVGNPAEVIRDYLAAALPHEEGMSARLDLTEAHRAGWTLGSGRLHEVAFVRHLDVPERPPWRVAFGEPYDVEIAFVLHRAEPHLVVGFGLRSDSGEDLFVSHSIDALPVRLAADARQGVARVTVGPPWLRPGTYTVEVALLSGQQVVDIVNEAARITIEEQGLEGAPLLRKGVAVPLWEWSIG